MQSVQVQCKQQIKTKQRLIRLNIIAGNLERCCGHLLVKLRSRTGRGLWVVGRLGLCIPEACSSIANGRLTLLPEALHGKCRLTKGH